MHKTADQINQIISPSIVELGHRSENIAAKTSNKEISNSKHRTKKSRNQKHRRQK